MAIISGELINENKLKVLSVSYAANVAPGPGWYQVNEVPDYPEPVFGMNHVRYYNPSTGQFWYELEPRELTPEEKLEQLEAETALLWYELMLVGGAS